MKNTKAVHCLFDLQVNGYAGIDFNTGYGKTNSNDSSDRLITSDQLLFACKKLYEDGIEKILLTIITDHIPSMYKCINNISKIIEKEKFIKNIITGFHIEGPFINPSDGYRGAHPLDAIKPASIEDMKKILEAGEGKIKIVTLAPEQDKNFKVTNMLIKKGIVVSAGHTDASLEQLKGAIDSGLSMFTHLGNGCPKQVPRHDNIIQRVLSLSGRLWISFIADGFHIPFFVLKNYITLAGINHCVIVSDAIAPAGLGPGKYTLGRWNVSVGKDLVVRSPDDSHLIGSAISLKTSFDNLIKKMNMSKKDVETLTMINPYKILKNP